MTLLPSNSTAFERALEVATDYDLPIPLRDMWNPDTCPIDILPWLAWSLSIDQWSDDWPEEVKRQRVKSAMLIARQKGTGKSVRDAVAAFGGHVLVREWFEQDPPGEPGTFKLVLTLGDGVPSDAGYVDDVIEAVDRTKPLTRTFTFTQGVSARGGIGTYAVARPAVHARISANGI